MIKKHKQFDLPKLPVEEADNTFELKQSNVLRTAKQIITDSRSTGKDFGGNYVVRGVQSTGYSTLTVFDSKGPGFCQLRTNGDYGNATVTLTGPGEKGQELYLKLDNDTDGAKVITFGGMFKVTGTVTGSTAATAILHFISDSTAFWEVSRTTGLNQ